MVQYTIPMICYTYVLTLILTCKSDKRVMTISLEQFTFTMHQEKYSVAWNTYSVHLKSMMKELMMNEDFSDVTLVTEDKKYIKAHMNILGAASPFFKMSLKTGLHVLKI